MQKNFFLLSLLAILIAAVPASAQERYFTRDAIVKFDATAKSSPEDIKATSNAGTCVLDKSNGNVEMAVLIKGFLFEKALMQEHFNENYMESSKFPKATFKGKIDNIAGVDFSKDGTYNTTASGKLTMHGVEQSVSAPIIFTVKNGVANAYVRFNATLADYGIKIPSLVSDKLAKQAVIEISATFQKM
jgi:polyisoprenoid-binding protein YceI